MSVDQIQRRNIDLSAHLNNPQVEDALRHGDIKKIMLALPAGVTRKDIEEYLKQRFVLLDQSIMQNTAIKSDFGAMPPPDLIENMIPVNKANAFSEEDALLLRELIGADPTTNKKSMSGAKAASIEGFRAAEGDGDVIDPESEAAEALADLTQYGEDLMDMVTQHQEERDQFMIDLDNQIFNTQLNIDLQKKSAELRKELQRIMSLIKSGKIAPEFAIIALAKIQQSDRGFKFALLGKQMMHVNQEQARVAESLYGEKTPAGFESAKLEINELSMSMSQITGSMQQLTQEIDSIISTSKSMLDIINTTKLELGRHLSVSGA